jgi:hypothetical protein
VEFIYIYEIEQRNFLQFFKWGEEGIEGERRRDDGGDKTNVQYKPNQNCHHESSLDIEYILIKIYFKRSQMGTIYYKSNRNESGRENGACHTKP